MKTIIYIDMLFLQGVIINYTLLLCTAKFSAMSFKRTRLLIAAVLGGIASFMIFLPSPPLLLQLLIKSLVTLIILLAAFRSNIKGYIKALLWYIFFNCILAGLLLLFQFSGGGFIDNNLQLYFDISAFTLIITTVILYLAVWVIRYVFNEHDNNPNTILLEYNNMHFSLTACYDSGFTAIDILQDAPLILIGYPSCKLQLPHSLCKSIERYFETGMPHEGMSVLPLGGVGGSELTVTAYPVTVTINEKKIEKVKLCFSKRNIEIGSSGCLLSKNFMEVSNNAVNAVVAK